MIMCRVPTLSLINLFSFAVVESPVSVVGTGSWEKNGEQQQQKQWLEEATAADEEGNTKTTNQT